MFEDPRVYGNGRALPGVRLRTGLAWAVKVLEILKVLEVEGRAQSNVCALLKIAVHVFPLLRSRLGRNLAWGLRKVTGLAQ
jgi:hypothetical protein